MQAEDGGGRAIFFQDRYKGVRLRDEASLLACAAYIDLKPIRAAMAQTIETSDHASIHWRIETLTGQSQSDQAEGDPALTPPANQ